MLNIVSGLIKSIIVFVVIGFQVLLYLFFAVIQASLIAAFSYLISHILFYPVFFVSLIFCFAYHLYDKIIR